MMSQACPGKCPTDNRSCEGHYMHRDPHFHFVRDSVKMHEWARTHPQVIPA